MKEAGKHLNYRSNIRKKEREEEAYQKSEGGLSYHRSLKYASKCWITPPSTMFDAQSIFHTKYASYDAQSSHTGLIRS